MPKKRKTKKRSAPKRYRYRARRHKGETVYDITGPRTGEYPQGYVGLAFDAKIARDLVRTANKELYGR